ncbi:hypothetical protein FPOA_05180 [Fusarium poae]|uniref:Heterokaryon incompatibility domain-containing protein n=1 Tax=Fusarium poae TaxID=36050 RepID=A0A1B8AVV4_FUSPO|nr:hypothetical protein FPOA_05180 [Fusarium poae]
MHNWHSPSCGRPDVVVYEGLGVPVCMDCGEMAEPFDVGKDHQDELDIPHSPKRSSMRLAWPPSVPYSDDPYRYDKGRSLCKALEQHLEQLCTHSGVGDATSHPLLPEAKDSSWEITSSGIKPVYKPLCGTKIRVLKLSRGRFESPLHGNLETIELHDDEPQTEESRILLSDDDQHHTTYEAISYTWATISGNRRKDHSIFIGKSWSVLPITENCFDALRSCRLEDEDRYLWVDSICINQSDVSERTHQVGLMRQIYTAANRVLIYLSVDHAGGNSMAVKDDPEILCLNPYFSRIWVVQEIGSAKRAIVLYRQQSMGWEFFHTNLQRLMTRKWVRHFGRPRQIDDAASFLALLEDTWDCHASDPRDKVFALLGLWKASVEPDYTLSPQAVYIGLASSFVTDQDAKLAGRVLDMASQGHSMSGLPSWVPDWSVKSQQLYRRVWKKTSFVPSTAISSGRSKRQKFRVHGGTGSLCAVAIEIDMLGPYLQKGFRVTTDGMATAAVGQIQVSLPLHVASRCKPTDSIFEAFEYEFFLILRKKTDTHIYTFVGLCDYQVLATPMTTQVDAIRYLNDWAWLLDGRRTWTWSKLANWEKTHKCWLDLQEQQSLERRLRHLLKGYKSLETLPETLEATQLTPSMWLPISSHWFQWIEHYGKDQLYSYYPPLAACIEKEIPLPPLNMVDTPEYRMSLFLEADLETVLRQLQLVARSYPLATPEITQKSRSYTLNTPHGYDFRTGYLDAFLRWLSKPWSPDIFLLKSKSNLQGLLIWETGFEDRYHIDIAHRRLDENFDKHLSLLSTSCEGETLFTKFFNFIYREQFELLWMFAFHNSNSTVKAANKFPALNISVEFARVFWWRFNRSIVRVFEVFGENVPSDDQIQQRWEDFLDWLSQGKQPSRVADLPLPEIEFKMRPKYDDNDSSSQRLTDFFSKLNYHGLFISTQLPGTLERPESATSDPPPRPGTEFAGEQLSMIVYSEIERRRLPEKMFAFLFNDTGVDQEPSDLTYTTFEAMVANKQSFVLGTNIVDRWSVEEEQWRAVKAYVSQSEWHMTGLKLKLVGGAAANEAEKDGWGTYQEIVIV